VWAWLNRPNILQCFGITANPLRVVSEWAANGDVMEYLQMRPKADRVCLVGSLLVQPGGVIAHVSQTVVDRRGPGT